VDVRLIARDAPDAHEAARRLDGAVARVEPVLAGALFRADASGDLVEAVAGRLLARGLTLATGESCTGGLIAKRLTDRPGSSAWFRGGVVAYADEVKTTLLGVDAARIERHGAVSEEVARGLAEGARHALGADCGIGVTGVAGPEGGSEAKPVGTVWYAASTPASTETRRQVFPGDREAVRVRAAQAALALLHRLLAEPER
jgi:PncC family amidohydrolase